MANVLYDALLARHRRRDAVFVQLPDGRSVSYAEMLELSAQFAHALADLGAKPGDRVALQVGKSVSALAVYFACVQGGFVLLPLNPAYTANEVEYFVRDARPAVLICDPADQVTLAPAGKKFGAELVCLDPQGQGSLWDIAGARPREFVTATRRHDDLAAILYTSGTTGVPKGAMLSHGNLLSNAQVLARGWRFTAEDVLLHALPVFHTHGLFVAVNTTLIAGGSIVFLPRFEVAEVMRLLPGASVMMGVPTFYTRLLQEADFTARLVRDMRVFISGSAPLLAETHAAFETRCGQVILERYGMTETSMSISNPYSGERRAGTVGVPLEGVEVIITDTDTGKPVSSGDIGMVQVRGPNVFQGYWNLPDKTREELQENGFFITGDLGRISADGYVEIVGRSKDLIISGGFNIYPKEVEAAIDLLPGVAETAVVGVPDADLGEVGLAFVVRAEGAGISAAEILAALGGQLARFKHPREVLFCDALPRNAMGKVQKKVLRELL